MPYARRRRKPDGSLSFAVFRGCDHVHHHHCGAGHASGRDLRTRQGSQGMSAATDIIEVSKPRPSRNWGAALVGVCFLLACLAPIGLNGYGLYIVTLTGIFALVALGLNLLTGYAGQISLCHASLFGVGAYATALLTQKAGFPYLLALLTGALLTT